MSRAIIRNVLGLITIIGLFSIPSCSPERTGLVGSAYHNLAAHYNGYFIAKEYLKEIQGIVDKEAERNFNDILNIYPAFDTTTAQSYTDQLEDAIKKASLPIQYHKHSNWIDDCYTVIGKLRYYNVQFPEAIETFKYVNTKSEDEDTRHEALVFLMRTFIEYEEYNNAVAVSDFLKKENLNKTNLCELYITRAYLYQKQENQVHMVSNLLLGSPMLKKGDRRARLYFIIGQTFQKLGYDDDAYENYKKSLKSNPDYELSFYTRLNMAQVYKTEKIEDQKKARKYFNNLLVDQKNIDFKDKIYYEIGKFEQKNNQIDDAITAYLNSAKNSVKNKRQKAYSFLRLGEIYYDDLKNYQQAKNFYDSLTATMPEDFENYKAIEERAEILGEFITQLNTVHEQDSLLGLAAMDSVSLNLYLDSIASSMAKEQKRLAKEAKKAARVTSGGTNITTTGGGFDAFATTSGATWYFYNTAAMSMGRNEFLQKWGNRKLEDDWRRSKKKTGDLDDTEEETIVEEVEEQSENEITNIQKASLLAGIPLTASAQDAANIRLEEAFYQLGNIYHFNLDEKENAVASFETLRNRYPATKHTVEAQYLLYLNYKEFKQEPTSKAYADSILTKFPNSIYAKIIRNPNFKEESKAANDLIKKLYAQAYAYYQAEDFNAADSIINHGMQDYPETDYTDNLDLIRILIIGQNTGADKYKYELQQFILRYPESDLSAHAEQLIVSADKVVEEMAKANIHKYILEYDLSHFFMLVYETKSEEAKGLAKLMENFLKPYADSVQIKLTSSNMILTEFESMIMISEFETKDAAMDFYHYFEESHCPLDGFQKINTDRFILSKDNFQILYQTKDLKNYLNFFDKHYKE